MMYKILFLITLFAGIGFSNCNKPQNDVMAEQKETANVQPVVEEKKAVEPAETMERKPKVVTNEDAAERILKQYSQRVALSPEQQQSILGMAREANLGGMDKAARQSAIRQLREQINQNVLTAEQRAQMGRG